MTQSEEAAQWMVLMEAGLAEIPQIIRWADEKIVAVERPDFSLIEISTSQEDAFHAIFEHLKYLRSDIDRFEALRLAAPALREAIESGKLQANSVATFTYTYLCGDFFDIPQDMRFLYAADDEFYLANVEGLGNSSSVEKEFIKALKNAEKA